MKNSVTYEHPTQTQFMVLWMEVGHMAFAGRLRLSDLRFLCETIAIYAVWCGNEENKTHTAERLETNRRRVRMAIAEWCNRGGLSHLLSEFCKIGSAPLSGEFSSPAENGNGDAAMGGTQ